MLGLVAAMRSEMPREALAAAPAAGMTTAASSLPRQRGRLVARLAAWLRSGLWLFDAAAAAAAMLFAHRLSPVFPEHATSGRALGTAATFAVAFGLAAYASGLYDWHVRTPRSSLALRILFSALIAGAATVAFFYVLFFQPVGRYVMGIGVGLSVPFILTPRYLLWRLLRGRPRRVLFVGRCRLSDATVAALGSKLEPVFEVAGSWEPSRGGGAREEAELATLCRALGVDELLLPTHSRELQPVLSAALRCLPLGCQVRSEADFYEDIFSAVPVRDVSPEWMLNRGLDTSNHVADTVKRLFDVALALLLVVPAAPVVAIAAALVALEDGRPLFFRQTRVGWHGRPFRILKLRTMRHDAESEGPQWAGPDDPRCTRVGAALRRLRVDELPQLVNILLGEMSFVGPRPERPEFVAELEARIPYYAWRHFVRPGLSGWAQLNHPYGASVEDALRKLEYDLYYVRHHSLLTDLSIALRTTTMALRGAR